MTRGFLLWTGVLLAAAAVMRLPLLSVRPMHTDEAVHAAKFDRLLEAGIYEYDPLEYHGPALSYATLVFARMEGKSGYADLTESFLRSVPAVFGILTVLLPFLFWDLIGRRAAVFASLLLALSPAFVFYSRYYIHEMLLVFFMGCLLGCLWRYVKKPGWGWSVSAGLSAGLMFATKETSILIIISAVLTALFLWGISFRRRENREETSNHFRPVHFVFAFAAFAAVWGLLFSSFGTHPQGLIESFQSYLLYPSHAGNMHIHAHPWWYYLDLLTWVEFFEPVSWNEDGIVVLAFFGLLFAFSRRHISSSAVQFLRFLALFTLILTVLYSAIPYKTPWNLLSFLYGMILLAAVAADRLLRYAAGGWERKSAVLVLLIFGLASPLVQSVFLNTRFACDPSNPYVYGHTGPDILSMVQKVTGAAEAQPEGKDLYIQVIAPQDDYWPWPWYLRSFSRVGYDDHIDPAQPAAPLIVASAAMEPEILKRLYEVPPPGRRDLYLPLFDSAKYLRPGVEWKGYIRKDLWDRFQDADRTRERSDVKEKQKGEIFVEPVQEGKIPALIHFSHNAMATVFEIFIQYDDPDYAARAAEAAFEETDHLESLLSRYVPNSDISRIATLHKGQSAVVSPETMECLQIARRLYDQTHGTFDITVGGLVESWEDHEPTPAQIREKLQTVGMDLIQLDPGTMSVTVAADSMNLDPGGIGKGYAVYRMAEVLKKWKVERALIHGGSSSVLAMESPDGEKGWKVRLSNPQESGKEVRLLEMKNEALSCSGLRRKHDMIRPSTGMPVQDKYAVWVRGPNPAECDGLSTAFMVMSSDEIKRFSQDHPEIDILIFRKDKNKVGDGELLQFGKWR